MKVKIKRLPPITISEFAEWHDLTMQIEERTPTKDIPVRWIASFHGCALDNGSEVCYPCGTGNTPLEAANDYSRIISGKLLLDGNDGVMQFRIKVPKLKDETSLDL